MESEEESYDESDIELVVLRGYDEEEDMDAGDAAFLRGYLGMGET